MFSDQVTKEIENIFKGLIDTYLFPKLKKLLNEDEPDYYTTKDLEKKFGLDKHNQYYYRKEGYITYTQIGRKIIYPREKVHEFLNDHTNLKKTSNG